MAHIDDPHTQRANLAYIKSSMAEPLLEKEHELNLARRWRDDKDERALHELVTSYTRLVISAATKFKHYGLPMGDLIQEGNIGLMQAANRFDPERDLRFSTYATWWIRSCMQDYVLRNWSIVRTGTTAAQKSLFFNFRRLRAQIESKKEHEGLNDNDRKKIAKKLNVKVKEVEDMEGRLSGGDQSLNAFVSEDGESEWLNFIADERPDPEEIVIGTKDAQARSKWLRLALSKLTDRERKIIKDRHLGYESVTLEALGNQLGVSKERVRQLEQRAMQKLHSTLTKEIRNVQDILLEA
jgi:RNA polymerase sigma-32 factor